MKLKHTSKPLSRWNRSKDTKVNGKPNPTEAPKGALAAIERAHRRASTASESSGQHVSLREQVVAQLDLRYYNDLMEGSSVRLFAAIDGGSLPVDHPLCTDGSFRGTALGLACERGHSTIARGLLDRGADMFTRMYRAGGCLVSGASPLELAVKSGSSDTVACLVAHPSASTPRRALMLNAAAALARKLGHFAVADMLRAKASSLTDGAGATRPEPPVVDELRRELSAARQRIADLEAAAATGHVRIASGPTSAGFHRTRTGRVTASESTPPPPSTESVEPQSPAKTVTVSPPPATARSAEECAPPVPQESHVRALANLRAESAREIASLRLELHQLRTPTRASTTLLPPSHLESEVRRLTAAAAQLHDELNAARRAAREAGQASPKLLQEAAKAAAKECESRMAALQDTVRGLTQQRDDAIQARLADVRKLEETHTAAVKELRERHAKESAKKDAASAETLACTKADLASAKDKLNREHESLLAWVRAYQRAYDLLPLHAQLQYRDNAALARELTARARGP